MRSLKLEALLLKQFLIFSWRHLRYFKIALALYAAQFRFKKKALALRSGFVFLQIIDDYLDGDRKCPRVPSLFIENFLQRFRAKHLNHQNELEIITEYFLDCIETNPAKDEIVANVDQLITTMLQDRYRLNGGFIWEQDRLIAQHHKTFGLSMDIALATLQSSLRISAVPALLDVFAWCSTMRDLSEDLSKGLCNIPLEVLSENSGGASGEAPPKSNNSALSISSKPQVVKISTELMRQPRVQKWIADENIKAQANLLKCEVEILQIPEQPGKALFLIFIKSMKAFHAKFSRHKSEPQFLLQE